MAYAPITMTVKGQSWASVGTKTEAALHRAVGKAARNVIGKAKIDMATGVKTGRRSTRGKNKKKVHVASAPGESPARDLGVLINSLHTNHPSRLTAEITVVGYGVDLDQGIGIEARPWVRPAMDKAQPAFEADVAAALAGGP